MSNLGAVLRANEARRRLNGYTIGGRARFLLGRDILGYDRLTESFHLPIFEWLWAHRNDPFVLFMAGRKHFKTTMLIIDVIADLLVDPNKTCMVVHAVEEEAKLIVQEAAEKFQKCDELRRLRPEIMPSKMAKKFKLADQFTLRRDRYDRQPSFSAKGIFSEFTGAHVNGQIRLDDIMSETIIADSAVPKVRHIFKNTIMGVRMPGCRIRATGTHWDAEDIYVEWKKNPGWKCMVRSALETNGEMDYNGTPVLLDKQTIEEERRHGNFPFQQMNDPSPQGEKLWNPAQCEHFIKMEDLGRGGRVVVLADPAPAKIGNIFGEQKRREDGEKDYWAIAAFLLRWHMGQRQAILLDGDQSKDWSTDEGFRRQCRMAVKWAGYSSGFPLLAFEAVGMAIAPYDRDLQRAAEREKIPACGPNVDRPDSPFALSMTYSGKNIQFENLAAAAGRGEFLILDQCNPSFLEATLAQARDWRAIGKRNNLKHDDAANCVSFCQDPVLDRWIPVNDAQNFAADHQDFEDEPGRTRSRYCAA